MKKLFAFLKHIDELFEKLFDNNEPDASFILNAEII